MKLGRVFVGTYVTIFLVLFLYVLLSIGTPSLLTVVLGVLGAVMARWAWGN